MFDWDLLGRLIAAFGAYGLGTASARLLEELRPPALTVTRLDVNPTMSPAVLIEARLTGPIARLMPLFRGRTLTTLTISDTGTQLDLSRYTKCVDEYMPRLHGNASCRVTRRGIAIDITGVGNDISLLLRPSAADPVVTLERVQAVVNRINEVGAAARETDPGADAATKGLSEMACAVAPKNPAGQSRR